MSASIILHLYVRSQALFQLSANAKIAGMEADLGLVGLEYSTAAAVFFVWFSLLAFLEHDQRSLRSFTVSRKSHRKSKRHFSFCEITFAHAEISFSSFFHHPDGVWPSFFSGGFAPLTRIVNAVPTIMVAWGLVMTLMCLVNTYQGLLA